jgi:Uncharacterized protein conserved in bacteria (DUF2188)
MITRAWAHERTTGTTTDPTTADPMVHITYKIVRHEEGWAYTVNGVFSESFATHAEALEAARRAAAEQRQPGQTEGIEYEDERGKWHRELARGDDRPETDVEDSA